MTGRRPRVAVALAVACSLAVASTAVTSTPRSGTAAALAADSTSPAPAAGRGRLGARAEIGFDSFQERYSIVEQDTVDSVSEWRARLRLGWTQGTLLHNYFHMAGRILAGEGNYETAAELRATRQLDANLRTRVSLDGEVTRRGFDENSSFQFPNDFLRYYLHAYAQLGTGDALSFRLSNRFERLDYELRTEYDYDFYRNAVTLTGEYEWGLTTYSAVALRYTTMTVPDSSEIDYQSLSPYVEFRSAPDVRRQIYFQGTAERRHYTSAQAARSSFWALLAGLYVEWAVGSFASIDLENNLERFAYDVNTDAYFDYFENRTVLVANYYPSYDIKLGAGGSYGFLAASQSRQDEYHEYGLVARAELSRGARLWLSLQYEPGKRLYPAFDPSAAFDLESVFSDYNYHRLSLFGTWRLTPSLGLNLFVDYQPEDHEREGDDATATLFSASISYVL